MSEGTGVMIDDTTRLRALCERAALPACEARLLRDDGAWCVVVPQGGEFCAVIAELSWSGVEPFGGGAVTEARAQLYAEAPAAIVGLCDARDQLVADAAATAARSVEEWADVARLVGLDRTALPLDVRRAVEHEIAERDAARDAADRVTAERDDLHAVLETRDAELTLAHERIAEHGNAATEAFDAIAAACGCPHWDYPGQVVRDVQALAAERDALRALCERFGGEEGVICNGYEDDSGCGGCGANANHSDADPANHAPDCVRLAARQLAKTIRVRVKGGR